MIDLESALAPEAVLARVKEAAPTPWEWRYGGGHTKSPYCGKVGADGFWVMKGKNRSEKNSFNPVLVAHVAPTMRGSRITAVLRIPLPVQAFLAFWCVAAVGIGGSGVYDAMTSGNPADRAMLPLFAVAVPVFVGIAGILYMVARSIASQRRPELEKWLRETVDAETVTA